MGLRDKDVSVFGLLFLFALSCENNSVLMYVGLSLSFLSCSIDLYFCFYASTILS